MVEHFQQASFLSGTVTNASNGIAISNATIQIVNTSYSATSNLLGTYSLASVNSGVFQVLFSAPGYTPLTLNVTLSSGVMLVLDAALNPSTGGVPGCTDPNAVNYDPNATVDDGSCIYCTGSWLTLNMYDTYGDGWNGNTFIATSTTSGTSYGPFTLSNGASGSQSFCLPDDCYDIICDYGTWQSEITWSLTDVTGSILLSGGAPYNSQQAIGTGNCVTTVVGCMNPNASNYDPLATSSIAFGGVLDPNTAQGAYFTGDQYLIFDAYVESKIISADVYAQASSTITFELRDNNASILDDTTITVSAGQQRLYFDFDVPVGSNYQLGLAVGSNSGLYRNNDQTRVNYPYNIGGLIEITESSAGALGYPDQYYYFFYDIEVEAVCVGVSSPILGCTNPSACNYDPAATQDDGSCLTAYGCTDPFASNYDPSATCDDGSCMTFTTGCMDPTACNYNPMATFDDGSCNFLFGCTDPSACNYDPTALCDDGSCNTVYGCTDPTQFNYDSAATCDDGSCIPFTGGCTDPAAANYNPSANTDDGSCLYPGCTDPSASNYDPNANVDDGSCITTAGCPELPMTGLFIDGIIDDRVNANFDNMNTYDANGDQVCRVDQIRINYRPVGTSSWSSKNIGSPVGYDATTGICNSTQSTMKPIRNLTLGTEYEWRVKVWYCSGGNGGWVDGANFTTADECPNVGNLTAYGSTPSRATFDWDASNGAYEFVRIKMRVDTLSNPMGTDWFLVGGFGVPYGTNTKNKNGLTPGQTYRGRARTWCDPNGGAYNSLSWSPLVTWTQPTNRIDGGEAISNLDVYPNPSKDVFNITFTSESRFKI